MGTILRSADACGIDGVFLCGCCDVFSSKVIRSTMGSLFRVNIAVMDIDTAIEKLKSNGITIYSAVIDKNAKSLVECDFTKGCAVMIGNEGNGLSEEHIALSNIPMTIKMKGRLNSLNAAMAAGIIMWEMSEKV